jgi:hypothetical protein
MAESKGLKEWRKKQKPGAIMKPSTFDKIVADAEKRGMSKASAKKVAGSAYWNKAEKGYRERKKK